MFDSEAKDLESATISGPHAGPLGLRKRLMDIALAGALLLMTLPLLLVIAALIKFESPGPVLFRQRRGGRGCTSFVILKFRTMTVAEDGSVVVQATRNDQRCTGVGRVLRKLSIDELPQLINVLKGDMSLVGPRPHALAHDAKFQAQYPLYRQRFQVRPGITGLAQVEGCRGEAVTPDDIARRLGKDLEYIDRWTFWGDVKILAATLKCATDHRAY